MVDSATVVHGRPGSGKTTHLVRICNEYVAAGAKVLLVTYTRVAARELVERMKDARTAKKVTASTLHSYVYSKVCSGSSNVVTQSMLVSFGKNIGVTISGEADITGEHERTIEDGDEIMSIISRADARGVDRMTEYMTSDRPVARTLYKYVSEAYDAWKKANGYVDFTDMLRLFDGVPAYEKFDVLIVDEAQDLSAMQWKVVRQICETVKHVIIAGDPDQQLFAWGGSDPEGMYTFADEYGASVHVLPKSYRLPRIIHSLSNTIIEKVKDRRNADYAPRDAVGEIVRHVSTTSIQPDPKADTLILYRTHAIRREIEDVLLSRHIAYRALNGFPDPWHNAFGRSVRAYKKSARGERLTQSDTRALRRFCAIEPTALRPWHTALSIPNRFIDYMVSTEGSDSKIRLSTIHGAKGKEADNVILCTGLSRRVVDEQLVNPDQEHRVFYVGVTRTRNRLDILPGMGDNYEL